MEKWIEAVSAELNITEDVDVEVVLDVARDAAHLVLRPAAPVTTYLLGWAVAHGADPKEAASRISALANGWGAGS